MYQLLVTVAAWYFAWRVLGFVVWLGGCYWQSFCDWRNPPKPAPQEDPDEWRMRQIERGDYRNPNY
jgi:hypothetical protein